MNKIQSIQTLSLLALMAPASIQAVTLTFDELNLRPDATGIYPGGGNIGSIVAAPGYTFPTATVNNVTSVDIDLRWQGLDLDGVGGTDDYIDFTVVGTTGGGNILWSGLGWGEAGSISAAESVTFTINNIALSPGTAGSVIFNGFTQGRIITSGGDNVALDGSLDVNGITVVVNEAADPGFDFVTPVTAAFTPVSALVYDNPNVTSGAFFARAFDLEFTHTIPEPSVAILGGFGLLGLLKRKR